MRKLIGLGVASHYAATIANDRKGYWFNAGNKAVNWALNKERLISWGYYDLATAYQSVHVNYWKPPCTERYARWCERTAVNHRLLLDL